MEACEIIAGLTVKGLVFLGESPVAGTYICSATTVNPYTFSIAPYVCTGVMSATQLGRVLASSDAGQEVLDKLVNSSCGIAVEIVGDTVNILAFKAKQMHRQTQIKMTETKRTVNVLNSAQGVQWLLNFLTRGY